MSKVLRRVFVLFPKSHAIVLRILLPTLLVVIVGLYGSVMYVKPTLALSDAPMTVTLTYYGGEYDAAQGGWLIDNANQCDRIAAGEFTAESLGGTVKNPCSDDNGLGSVDDLPLHNRVSFAELSNPPGYNDFVALGGLKIGTKIEINYQGRCVVAEKLDVGTGGYGIGSAPRAVDLWWQTARTIGFTDGLDTATVRLVPASTPLSPLGKLSTCLPAQIAKSSPPPAPAPAPTPAPPVVPSINDALSTSVTRAEELDATGVNDGVIEYDGGILPTHVKDVILWALILWAPVSFFILFTRHHHYRLNKRLRRRSVHLHARKLTKKRK